MVACASTFAKGQQASEQRPDFAGRPGLNPLRFKTTYHVTQQQFDTLQEIAVGLGLEERRLEGIQMGFRFPPDEADVLPFLDNNFKLGSPRIATEPNAKDLDAIALWVRAASMRSDLVVASIHAHEQGETKEDPAEFIVTYARRMIDEGAAVATRLVYSPSGLLLLTMMSNGRPSSREIASDAGSGVGPVGAISRTVVPSID